jgi:hypothetical protein
VLVQHRRIDLLDEDAVVLGRLDGRSQGVCARPLRDWRRDETGRAYPSHMLRGDVWTDAPVVVTWRRSSIGIGRSLPARAACGWRSTSCISILYERARDRALADFSCVRALNEIASCAR